MKGRGPKIDMSTWVFCKQMLKQNLGCQLLGIDTCERKRKDARLGTGRGPTVNPT